MTVAITSHTTEDTLNIIENFQANRMPRSEAQELVSDLLEQAIVDIEANPQQYPPVQSAQEYGYNIRKWIDPTQKYVCLYRYDELTDTAVMDVFASTKQDWLNLLYLVLMTLP